MTPILPPGEIIPALRGLAAGVSLAALILVPSGQQVSGGSQKRTNHDYVELVTTLPDGNVDPRTAFYRTRHGLKTSVPVFPQAVYNETADKLDLPAALREVSGLPIAALAQLVGVSRMRYHEWLNGSGISDDRAARMTKLHEDFVALRSLLGPDIRSFLEASSPHGSPLDLLRSGDSPSVIGLALRRPTANPNPQHISDEARQISGVASWLRPVRRLAWGGGTLSEARLTSGLEALSPRLLPDEASPPVDQGGDQEDVLIAFRISLG